MTRREFLQFLIQTIIIMFTYKHVVYLPIVTQEIAVDKVANKGFVFPVTFPFILGESNAKR